MSRVPAWIGAVLFLGADASQAAPRSCDAWMIEYALAPGSVIEQTRTPLRAADGTFPMGPGTLVLRVRDDGAGRPGEGPVALVAYQASVSYSATTSLIGLRTTVDVRAVAQATPDACGVVARGMLSGHALVWSTPVRGYRMDGTVTCRGALCGRFGMPRAGESPLHVGPDDVTFSALAFPGRRYRRLEMPLTQVSPSRPAQATTRIRIVARAVGRQCAPAPACR